MHGKGKHGIDPERARMLSVCGREVMNIKAKARESVFDSNLRRK